MFKKCFFLATFCMLFGGNIIAHPVKLTPEETEIFFRAHPPSHPIAQRALMLYREIQAGHEESLGIGGTHITPETLTLELIEKAKGRVHLDKKTFAQYHPHVKSLTPQQFPGIFPLDNILDILAQGCKGKDGQPTQNLIFDEVLERFSTLQSSIISPEDMPKALEKLRASQDHDITVAKNVFVYLLHALDPQRFSSSFFKTHRMGYVVPMPPESLDTPETLALKREISSSPLFCEDGILACNAGFQFGWPSVPLYPHLLSTFEKQDFQTCRPFAFDVSAFVSYAIGSRIRLSIPDFEELWRHQMGQDVGDQKAHAETVSRITGLNIVRAPELPQAGDIVLCRNGANIPSSFTVFLQATQTSEGALSTYFGMTTRKGPSTTGLWEGCGVGEFPFENARVFRIESSDILSRLASISLKAN